MITYVAGSYYPQYGDPIATAVALCRCERVCRCKVRQRVETALRAAAEEMVNDLREPCDASIEDEECACDNCWPPIIAGDACSYCVKDLLTGAELKEHRRALMNGEIVWLSR